MAKPRWLGRALAVAHVDTLTVGGTVEADDLFLILINGKTLSVVAGSTNVDTVAATIATAYNASTVTEFTELTALAQGSGGTLTLTGDVAGVPHTITVSTTEADGGAADAQTFVLANTTVATGPNWVDNTANWDTGAVPTTGDDAFIDNTNVSLLYGLDQISGNTLTSLTIAASFTGEIGLPKTNVLGYPEYRPTAWDIDVTTGIIGNATGVGSGRIILNFSAVQVALTIFQTGSGLETGIPAVIVKGTNASNTIEVKAGTVGVALFGGEVATFVTALVNAGALEFGEGCTLGSVSNEGATVRINSAVTTVLAKGGNTFIRGTGAVTTVTVTAGTLFYFTSGTGTTVVVGPGLLDCFGDLSARTFTNTTIKRDGSINDPSNTITHTNAVIVASDVRRIDAT